MKKLAVLSIFLTLCTGQLRADSIRLDELDISRAQQDWGNPRRDKSVEGHPLSIGGVSFGHGLGTHAISTLYVSVNGGTRFQAKVGVDGEVKDAQASVEFFVIGDGKTLWRSGVMRTGEAAREVDVPIEGTKMLILRVGDADDGINFDHADWADARFEYSGAPPTAEVAPHEEAVILTPPPPLTPRINGPEIVGARPGHPFFYHIPVTGERPMTIIVGHLPRGLNYGTDATGQTSISGTVSKPGKYRVTLKASNAAGQASKTLMIEIGNIIAMTPPMGWNSWNCFAGAVDDAKIRAAADAMVQSGLIDHGWTYVNIDDCWQGERDANGMIQGNKKFPAMKALADYIHNRGLKAGIYSSPGPKTCAGFEGSWQHEEKDAQQYANWGFDYLKYDWCSYTRVQDKSLPDPQRLMQPYQVMDAALASVDRDIVYSLCQYGMGDVWKWGAEVGGNVWRTTGDITDSWGSMSRIGFGQNGHEQYAGPGHWNDPDMLVVGQVGWGHPHPTHLTPNEQYTHVSLWCLLSAPLLIGADMSQLDKFTFSLLSNDEVLAVDQDRLGRPAGRISKDGETEVWARNLANGSKAVGLFNRGEQPVQVRALWKDLGIKGKRHVRDLWRQQDLGRFQGQFTATVPRHGVCLVRIW